MRNNKVAGFLLAALIIMSVSAFAIISFILRVKIDTLRTEAVQKGFAEWVVDASGETEWRWRGGDK